MSRGFFITGTDTGVGKTVFTTACVRALRDEGRDVAAYKPVCSGAEYREGEARFPIPFWPDVELLLSATQAAFPRERLCPQTFLAPLSPPAAAALEGREVDEALLLSG